MEMNKHDGDFDVEDSDIDLSALQQAIDTTWGRSSTPNSATFSVKFSIVAGALIAKYQSAISFANQQEMIYAKRRNAEESEKIVNEVIKQVKKTYRQISGKTLKLSKRNSSDSVELTSTPMFNSFCRGYFRLEIVFNMS
jgi:hypothetical protein